MREEYERSEIEVICFDADDVIVTSNCDVETEPVCITVETTA